MYKQLLAQCSLWAPRGCKWFAVPGGWLGQHQDAKYFRSQERADRYEDRGWSVYPVKRDAA